MIQAAAWGGNEEIATVFLERGADINESGGEFGSVLQAAVPFCPERFIKFLLDKGADVNLQGGEEGNALRAALVWPRENIIKLLLEHGADIHFSEPGKYDSAFQLALGRGDLKIINLLLNHGKNVNPDDEWYSEALLRTKAPGKERAGQLLLQWKVRAELVSK
jgi:ankyrin repeat protein